MATARNPDGAPLRGALLLLGVLAGVGLGVVVLVQALGDGPPAAPGRPPEPVASRPATPAAGPTLRELPGREEAPPTVPPPPAAPEAPAEDAAAAELARLRETPIQDVLVPSVAFEDAPGEEVLAFLAKSAGRRLEVDPAAREKVDSMVLNLGRGRTPVTTLLDMALRRFRLTWRDEGDAIRIVPVDPNPPSPPRVPRIR